MKKLAIFLSFLFLSVFILPGKTQHVLSIEGNAFFMDGKPFNMWGIRVASATEDGQSLAHLTAQLDDYSKYGVNTLAVYLMGSSGGAYDPFNASGTKMDKSHRMRMEQLVREADKRGMAVVIGIFYQRVPEDRIRLQDWVQGKSTGKVNRYELGGAGTPEDPGIRWYFEYVKESTSSPSH